MKFGTVRTWLGIGCAAVKRRPVEALFAASASALLIELLIVVVQRLFYPFELEWMEGGAVTEIQAILSAKQLYAEPSIEFTPFLYPPVFFYVSALVAKVVGVGILAPRLVSVGATVGSLILIARLVRLEGGRPLSVLVALSLAAVSFQRSGFVMDLARVDSLFAFIGLLAFYRLRTANTRFSFIQAGLLFTVCFFTKQTGIILCATVLLGASVHSWRTAALSAITTGVSLVVVFLYINQTSSHWFEYYMFTVSASHPIRSNDWWPALRACFWEPLPIALILAVAAALSGSFQDRRVWMYAGLCLGALVGGFTTLIKQNGWINGIVPWLLYLSIMAGIGFENALRVASNTRWVHVALASVGLQWFAVSYSPNDQIPSRRDRAMRRQLVEKLRDRPGPILAFNSNYMLLMAGHQEMSAHTMTLIDVFDTHDGKHTDKLSEEIRASISSGRYATIITDETTAWLPGVMESIRQNYREEPALDGVGPNWTKRPIPKSLWSRARP